MLFLRLSELLSFAVSACHILLMATDMRVGTHRVIQYSAYWILYSLVWNIPERGKARGFVCDTFVGDTFAPARWCAYDLVIFVVIWHAFLHRERERFITRIQISIVCMWSRLGRLCIFIVIDIILYTHCPLNTLALVYVIWGLNGIFRVFFSQMFFCVKLFLFSLLPCPSVAHSEFLVGT